MSTPEDSLPGELRLLAHGPAEALTPTTDRAPTPGVSYGVTRVPTSPTLPEPDSGAFTLMLARMASELYAAPTAPNAPTTAAAPEPPHAAQPSPGAVPSPAAPTAPATVTRTTPTRPAPATPAPAAPVSTTADGASAPTSGPFTSPFEVSPNFDGLFSSETPRGLEYEAARVPLFEENPDASAPYFVPTAAPSSREAAAPSSSREARETPHAATGHRAPSHPEVPAYEVQPLFDLRLPQGGGGFDAHALKKEFPILEERVHGRRLVWLDNAATTQKPRAVIDRLGYFYEHENSNIHRAAHALAARATDAYERARETVRRFLNAPSTQNVVFVRGATEGINLVAQSWGRRFIEPGDEVLVSWLEHHANIVPWQQLCAEKGARLRVAPVDDRGQVLLDAYERLLTPRTKLVAFTQVSNALGTVTPAKAMIDMAHRHGAKVLLDGAQSVSHMRVDLQLLDCDFFVFSGHKVFAPTGIGAVIAKTDALESMPPWQGGGNMIQDVTFDRTVFQPPPARFEAGTGNIADAVGLGAALDWLTRVGIENVAAHEHDLLAYATERVSQVRGLTIIGTAPEKAGVLSFVLDGHSTQEVSSYLDRHGIAVRGGHHCAQPILRRFGLESTVRASFAPYNTHDDVDALVDALCALQAQG